MMKNPFDEEEYKKRITKKKYSIRGEYFRDQTAIIHSMPFRRLKHKTQVFFSPKHDHVCTRIEHVMHVATIAATICKGLKQKGWELDSELAYAIGLGHDLGHAPFGHAGETALNRILDGEYKFYHEIHSLRVADKLCYNGNGLNLTYAVRDGIVNHNGEAAKEKFIKPSENLKKLETINSKKYLPSSYEGCIVRISDKIAYLGRDIEDALIAKIIKKEKIPKEIRKEVGYKNGEIINKLVNDVIDSSEKNEMIAFSDDIFDKFQILYDFNMEYIYKSDIIMKYRKKGEKILEEVYAYLLSLYNNYGKNYNKYKNIKLDRQFGSYLKRYKNLYDKEETSPKLIVCDYIAGMTDNYVLDAIEQIKIPEPINFV